jgi:hypothetical protein
MRRILVALLLASAACARTPVASSSGVEGTVTIGPQCPVERADQPCPDKPFAAKLLIVRASDGKVVARTNSGADGRFRVAVAPGSYRIEDGDSQVMPFLKPVDVVVQPGAFATVSVSFDSGIR